MNSNSAPLRITKRTSLPSTEHSPQRPSLLSFRRSSSTQSTTKDSSSEATVIASNNPPLYTGWQFLDVPKVRPGNIKSGAKSNKKEKVSTLRCSSDVYTQGNSVGRPPLNSAFGDQYSFKFQQIVDRDDPSSQSQGRISHFFQSLDKKISRHSIRGFSKRLSSNIRSIHLENESYSPASHSPLGYNLAPPISVLNMRMHVDDGLSDFRKSEAYVHVTITADVNMESAQFISYSLDIRAVILLNITSDTEMVKVTALTQVIIEKLKERDSFVVACVNSERCDHIDVLFLPNETQDLDLKRLLTECASIGKQLMNGAFRDDDLLGDAVERASRMFETNTHSTPHVFLVSANRDTTLNTAYNANVGLTTVTLEDHYDFGPVPRFGWHIYPETDLEDSPTLVFEKKVEKALCHIRSGFTSGTITNLHLRIAPATGSEIQVCGRTSIASLRPGEIWKVLVRVSMPEKEDFVKLEREIKSLLSYSDASGKYSADTVLVATLRFNHSLQPNSSSKIVKSCHVTRG